MFRDLFSVRVSPAESKEARNELRKVIFGGFFGAFVAACVWVGNYINDPTAVELRKSSALFRQQLSNDFLRLNHQYSLELSNRTALMVVARTNDLAMFSALLERWHSNTLTQITHAQTVQMSNWFAQSAIENRLAYERQGLAFSNRLAEITAEHSESMTNWLRQAQHTKARLDFNLRSQSYQDLMAAFAELETLNFAHAHQWYYLHMRYLNYADTTYAQFTHAPQVTQDDHYATRQAFQNSSPEYERAYAASTVKMRAVITRITLSCGSEVRSNAFMLYNDMEANPPRSPYASLEASKSFTAILSSKMNLAAKLTAFDALYASLGTNTVGTTRPKYDALCAALANQLEEEHVSLESFGGLVEPPPPWRMIIRRPPGIIPPTGAVSGSTNTVPFTPAEATNLPVILPPR